MTVMTKRRFLALAALGAGVYLLYKGRAGAAAKVVITPYTTATPATVEFIAPTVEMTSASQASVLASAVQEIVKTAPETQTVQVVSDIGSFWLDVPSTTAAAEISGMSYTDWLNLYAYGIAPSGIGFVGGYLVGKTLYGRADGTSIWL